MLTISNIEVISDKFNTVGTYISENHTQKLITKFFNYY